MIVGIKSVHVSSAQSSTGDITSRSTYPLSTRLSLGPDLLVIIFFVVYEATHHTARFVRISSHVEGVEVGFGDVFTRQVVRIVANVGLAVVVAPLEEVAGDVGPPEEAAPVAANRAQEAGDAALVGVHGVGDFGV